MNRHPNLLLLTAALLLQTACGDDDNATSQAPDTGLADVVPADDAGSDSAPNDAGLKRVGPLDTAGRFGTAELLIAPANRQPFNELIAGGDASTAGADFQAQLSKIDMLDGVDDWQGGGQNGQPVGGVYPHPLANLLMNDALLVDPSKPFSPSGYLEIEREIVGLSGPHATCGGRWLGDDAADKALSLMVNKGASPVSDGVAAPAKAPSLQFPYLPAL